MVATGRPGELVGLDQLDPVAVQFETKALRLAAELQPAYVARACGCSARRNPARISGAGKVCQGKLLEELVQRRRRAGSASAAGVKPVSA
jgi:hypothetical protein